MMRQGSPGFDRDIGKPCAIGRPGGRNIVIGIAHNLDALAGRQVAHIDLPPAAFGAGGIGKHRSVG